MFLEKTYKSSQLRLWLDKQKKLCVNSHSTEPREPAVQSLDHAKMFSGSHPFSDSNQLGLGLKERKSVKAYSIGYFTSCSFGKAISSFKLLANVGHPFQKLQPKKGKKVIIQYPYNTLELVS